MPSCSRARPLDSVRVRSPSNDMNTHGCVSCPPAPQQRDRLRAAPHVKRSWIWVPLVMASALEGCSGSAGLPEVPYLPVIRPSSSSLRISRLICPTSNPPRPGCMFRMFRSVTARSHVGPVESGSSISGGFPTGPSSMEIWVANRMRSAWAATRSSEDGTRASWACAGEVSGGWSCVRDLPMARRVEGASPQAQPWSSTSSLSTSTKRAHRCRGCDVWFRQSRKIGLASLLPSARMMTELCPSTADQTVPEDGASEAITVPPPAKEGRSAK